MQQLRSQGAAPLSSLRRTVVRVSANTTLRLSAVALLAIGIVVACDTVPLTSPTGSTISLSIDRNILPVNGQATVIAVVTESSGTAVHNGTVVTFQPSIGRTDPVEAQTVNGKATVTFLAGSVSGAGVIHAFSGAARTGSGNSSAGGVEVKIGTAGAERVTVRTEPLNVPVSGGTVSVIASLFDVSGNPIINTPIAFSSDFGSLSSNSAITDQNGEARVSLTTNRTTRITATAGAKSGDFTLSVLSPPTVTLGCGASGNTSATVGVPVNCTITAAPGSGNGSPSAPIQNVTINWGDNSGEMPVGVNSTTSVSHIYTNPGTFVVTAAATDFNSQRGQAVLTLNVQRSIPSISISASATNASAGVPISFTVTPPASPAIATTGVTVNFGDGQSRELGAITSPTTVNKTYGAPGSYTVTATIRDAAGGQNFASTAVQINQGAPPTVALNHTSSPANVNRPESFTVSATPAPGGPPVTNVRVTLGDGTVLYDGAATGSFIYTFPAVNDYALTARATDAAGNVGTTIMIVTVAP